MARLLFDVNLPATPLTNGTPKTVIQVKAPTNQRVSVLAIGLYVDGISATNLPVQVRFLKQSSGGTSLISATPHPVEDEITESIQTTCQTGSSTTQTEPTLVTVRQTKTVNGFTGQYENDQTSGVVPLFEVAGGTYLGIEMSNPAGNPSMNVYGYLRCEE